MFSLTYLTDQGKMACFIKSVSRDTIKDLELGNPFLRMKLFPFIGVENKPLTLEDVPQHYRPYPGCIFVSLEGRESEGGEEGRGRERRRRRRGGGGKKKKRGGGREEKGGRIEGEQYIGG